jgi:chromosome partitioning protein
MAGIIAVANQKGGVGKTATTANLGTALARLGRRVLMVDMDPQGNLTASFGANDRVCATVGKALLDPKLPLPAIPVRDGLDDCLDLLPEAGASLAEAEASLSNKLGKEFRLRDVLGATGNRYEFILIDTPPSLGLLTVNSLVAASRVIVPTEARFFSLAGLKGLEDTIEGVRYYNPGLKILGILLSKLDRRLNEEKEVADYLRDQYGATVFATEIGTNSKILKAASSAQPLYEVQGAGRASELYVELAKEVLGRG